MFGLFAAGLIVVVFVYFLWWAWKYYKLYQALSRIPGPKGYPFVGNALQIETDVYKRHAQLNAWHEEYKEHGLFCVWFGTNPVLLLSNVEYIEKLLTSQKSLEKAFAYRFLEPWLGTGLLTSHGEKWKSRRKLLTKAFHFKILNNFVPVFFKQSAVLIGKLQEKVGKGAFDMTSYITLCVLDIICETSMGVDAQAQNNNDTDYIQAVMNFGDVFLRRVTTAWLYNDTIFNLSPLGRKHNSYVKTMHDFTNKVITERIKEREGQRTGSSANTSGASPLKRRRELLAFLDLLLEEHEQGNIDVEGVREEVDTFMFEGHDTTSSSLLWTLHHIGEHPDVQKKLQKEVDNFYDSVIEDEVTIDHLRRLNYLECVIKESSRCSPAVPRIARTLSEDMKFGPHLAPKGCIVDISFFHLHRDSDYWPDPLKFDPDRFNVENSKGRNPFVFTPFSAGSRNCIGQKFAVMEEKIILSQIIKNFEIESMKKTKDLMECLDIVLRSLEGFWLKLKSREK